MADRITTNWQCPECGQVASRGHACLSSAPACSIASNDGLWRLRYEETKHYHAGCTITVLFRVIDGTVRGPRDEQQGYPPATFGEFIGGPFVSLDGAVFTGAIPNATLERVKGQ